MGHGGSMNKVISGLFLAAASVLFGITGCGGSGSSSTSSSFIIENFATGPGDWEVEWSETKIPGGSNGGITNTKSIAGTVTWISNSSNQGTDNFIGGVYKTTDSSLFIDPECAGISHLVPNHFRHLMLSVDGGAYVVHLFIPVGTGTLEGASCVVDASQTDVTIGADTVVVKKQ